MTSSTATPGAAASPRWVVLSCGDRRLALPLDRVQEITPPRPFTRLPGCGPEVCGLVGHRGRVVTVCDLGLVLGLRPAAGHADHRLVLLEDGGRTLAVVVEEVVTVAAAEVEDVTEDDAARGLPGLVPGDAWGVAELAGERTLLLDPDALMDRLLAG